MAIGLANRPRSASALFYIAPKPCSSSLNGAVCGTESKKRDQLSFFHDTAIARLWLIWFFELDRFQLQSASRHAFN